jgi:hypothetical protein
VSGHIHPGISVSGLGFAVSEVGFQESWQVMRGLRADFFEFPVILRLKYEVCFKTIR